MTKNKLDGKLEISDDSSLCAGCLEHEDTIDSHYLEEDLRLIDAKINKEIKFVDNKFNIDRKMENQLVCKYQEEKDASILEKLYEDRVPTLKFWAKKHYFPGLYLSEEDLFSELSITFLKAVNGYKRNRGDFNTCLYTFLLNRLKNIKSGAYAKKRTSDIYDGPKGEMIVSLDSSASASFDNDCALEDTIFSSLIVENSTSCSLSLEDTIDILCSDDREFRIALSGISEGKSLSALVKEYKTKIGRIKVKENDGINAMQAKNIIKNKISEEFKIISYKISDGHLEYEIELKKNEKAENVIKKIKELKKNKDYYLNKLNYII